MDDVCCNPPHPLDHDGTSQNQRAPAMLDPEKISLDGRSLEDLLVWATRFAKEINFYGASNTISGDWQSLIKNDPTTLIALISLYDFKGFQADFRTLEKTVQITGGTEDEKIEVFKAQCDQIIALAALFQSWYSEAPPELLIFRELKTAIRAELAPALVRLKSYDLGAETGLRKTDGSGEPLNLDYKDLTKSESLWGLASATASERIYKGETFEDKLLHASEKISALFGSMQRILVRTSTEAPATIANSLDWPYHQPHMALFIAFLKVFAHAQGSLNSVTRRHLDYYYQDVLQLGRKASVADKAHLVFALANNQKTVVALKSGSEFKAGKDADGNNLTYVSSGEKSLNRATVADIRAIHGIEEQGSASYRTSIVANSADGQGADFEDASKAQWRTFGQKALGETQNRPDAIFGMVIASAILRLAEGTRTVTLTFGYAEEPILPAAASLGDLFSVEVSVAAGWLKLSTPTITAQEVEGTTAWELKLSATIGPDDPPVAPFEEGSEFDIFDSDWPLLKLSANPSAAAGYFDFLSEKEIQSFAIKADVQKVRSLLLENELGPLAANKPFAPFGNSPKKQSGFLVGSWEALQKNLSSFTLNFHWDTVPTFKKQYAGYTPELGNGDVSCSAAVLSRKETGGWKPHTITSSAKLFLDPAQASENASAIDPKAFVYSLTAAGVENVRNPDLEVFDRYSNTLGQGYIRISLEDSLLHEQYITLYTAAAIKLAKETSPAKPPTVLPEQPYVPIALEITLDYVASDSWDLGKLTSEDAVGRLFHIYPFGHKRLQASGFGLLPSVPLTSAAASQMQTDSGQAVGSDKKQTGELFIGLKNAPVSEQEYLLSLLFQVADGTEDPRVAESPTASWSYLASDKWVKLEPNATFFDGTNSLIQPGIISFKIGPDATTDNTLLPSGLLWLRGEVDRDPDGVCDMIAVWAQAAEVVFEDRQNSASHLAEALAAETIKKMVKKDARISSVSQPYASFGGQLEEQDNAYYVRVSERLRHKERAVAMWDYERLVLEHFPDIYKVKCLSHATDSREIAPGNTVVIVVPNVRNKNGFDRLKPYASQAVRNKILDVVRTRAPFSLQNRIQVLNPVYEEIATEFEVVYRDKSADFGLTTEQLQQDIVRYLSPWAFSEGRDISFGGRIYASAIVDFIDERPYVDSIHNFVMKQSKDSNFLPVIEAVPQSARSILVAAPERSHLISQRPKSSSK